MTRKPSAEIVLDSVSPFSHDRLTTMVLRFPRIVLAELNTHRVFSRNSASSRAIPTRRLLGQVWSDPFTPNPFTALGPGMASNAPAPRQALLRFLWRLHAKVTVAFVWLYHRLGVHKQHANRPLETFLWHTALVSSTEWANFLSQRKHTAAQPEMRELAESVDVALRDSIPVERIDHCPFVHEACPGARMVSAGRCATVSYDNLGEGVDVIKDHARAGRMLAADPPHPSPFEHVARAGDPTRGNFSGWIQMREDHDL